MATLLIRKLDDAVKQRLRVRAAEHGRSMEDEAREILMSQLAVPAPGKNMFEAIRSHFVPFDIELTTPPRIIEPDRNPFEE